MAEQIIIPVLIFVGLGLLAGILLSIFSKIFAVKIDERVEEIRESLPGLNCGVCGFSGCDDYAKNLVMNSVATNRCIPGGDDTSKQISTILGTDYQDVIEQVAFVKCAGAVPRMTHDSYIYQGERTCAACDMFYKGKGTCDFGCIGYGDCVHQCSYGAITIVENVATINPKLCKGCSLCVAVCPKQLISIREEPKRIFISCSSCNEGRVTHQKCQNGCVGCGRCVKVCSSGAITVSDNLARIDYDKCDNCLQCVICCPKKCIEVV